MDKKIRVFMSPEALKIYCKLKESPNKKDQTIVSSIMQKIEFIRLNPQYGNPLSKKLIPQEYQIKYDVKSAYRVELPNFWRMIYHLSENESRIEILALIFDILSHPEYDKKFGYKKK